MFLEGIVVCNNYSDFLSVTLPLNKVHFNNMVVVTSTADKRTQKLCEYHHIKCVQTDRFFENKDPFNKGKGINVGLDSLYKKDWILHIDADIVLTPLTRIHLDNVNLDPTCIYGIDRLMCPDYKSWVEFSKRPRLINENNIFTHLNAFPVGTRVVKFDMNGYIPIGFFQLWNQKTVPVSYPEQHGDAARSDMAFALKWPREKRLFLPEIACIHLESGPAKMSANWFGRTTKEFCIVDEAELITLNSVVKSSVNSCYNKTMTTIKSLIKKVLSVKYLFIKKTY